jgi:hypothetical protein
MRLARWRSTTFGVLAALVMATGHDGRAAVAIQIADQHADRVGQSIAPWSPGTMDIHQISTGRGNAALVVMPDGTTLLVDAGAATAPVAGPRPNGSRSPAGWIAYYVDHVLPAAAARRLDYAVITHFHADHMGQIAADSPASIHGDYRLAGITEVAELVSIRKVVDRGWPDYAYPAPLTDPMVRNYRRFLEQRIADRSLVVERIRVGRADQIVPVIDPGAYSTFEIRNVAANGEVWTGRGATTVKRFPTLKTPDPDISWENICSIGIRRSGRPMFMSSTCTARFRWRARRSS